ncbi:MAG: tetratricopeptide repeat protein [Parcubacteria group bacterium]|nr:tetratricopeptide repeat protein [Parcubacteria group bacterium]
MDIKIPISKSESYSGVGVSQQKNTFTSSVETAPKEDILDTLAFWILLGLVFLLPTFFLPIGNLSIFLSKNVVLSAAVCVVALLWLIARLKKGEMVIPKTSLLITGALLPVVFLIASLLSPSPRVSLIGIGSEIGTFFSITILFLLMFFSSIFFQSKKRVFWLYTALAASALVVALFQMARLFGAQHILSFGFFSTQTSNLLGRWNELGVFFGMTALWSLISLALFSSHKLVRGFLYFLLAVSLFFVLIVNFTLVWIVLGLFALISLVYAFSLNKNTESVDTTNRTRVMPIASLALLVLAIFAIFGSSVIGNAVSSTLRIEHFEARPTFATTYTLFKDTIAAHPFFGVGPNRFTNQWLLLKPDAVNTSPFWNVDFAFGISVIATFAITAGIVGLLVWIIFLTQVLYVGFRKSFAFSSDRFSHYLAVSSFLVSVYLWIFMLVYVPSNALVGLAFLMTGAWIGLLVSLGGYKQIRFSFSKNPQRSFVSVLIILVLGIGCIAGIYMIWQKMDAAISFEKSSALFAAGDISNASIAMERAARLGGNALYYRSLADIHIAALSGIKEKVNLSIDEARSQFQTVLGAAIENARQAIGYDATDYLNLMSLARVYESVVPLGISGAYENAKRAYEEALLYNPKNPVLPLSLARLALLQGNHDEARVQISRALTLKNNYTDAIFLLSRIEADEGKIADAIASAEIASLISPNDTGLFFHLGLLRYTNKDYGGAISAFERAVLLQSNYANAKYFLGLSYQQMGETANSIIQFEDIARLNPDNSDVKKILANLKAGKSPFGSGQASSPEKSKTPPIRE